MSDNFLMAVKDFSLMTSKQVPMGQLMVVRNSAAGPTQKSHTQFYGI